jgi:hypothetical protein
MKRAFSVLVGVLLLAGAGAAAAQELGRLFFTPQQRAELDARRKSRVPDKPAAVAVVESPRTRLDGYVKRSGGKSTVWVNGDPVPVGAGSADARIYPSRNRSDTVTLRAGEGDAARGIRLRVGETLERDTGEVQDVIGNGKIEVSPAPAGSRRER